VIAIALLVAAGCAAGAPAAPAVDPRPVDFDATHAALDTLLHRHVVAGRVDYAGLAADRPALEAYLHGLEAVGRAQEGAWTRDARLAFWIDAYNAYTLRVILDHQPVKSIRAIGLLPFSAFRAAVAPLRARPGAAMSLDDIEKGVLRGEFAEPRVHFAISCASASCPALQSRAWLGDGLDAALDAAARAFLADPTKNRWDPATRTAWLSSIFDWYAADFTAADGSVLAYVARYAPPEMAAGIAAGGVTVSYLDYDWSLNAQP
jgi:hypothetical protein